jgi:hypothetical protein
MQTSSDFTTPLAAACDGARATRASAGIGLGAIEHQPRPVIRGESRTEATAHIDWFACTWIPANKNFITLVESVLDLPQTEWRRLNGGWQG